MSHCDYSCISFRGATHTGSSRLSLATKRETPRQNGSESQAKDLGAGMKQTVPQVLQVLTVKENADSWILYIYSFPFLVFQSQGLNLRRAELHLFEFPRLASHLQSSRFGPTSSWDYSHVPLCPGTWPHFTLVKPSRKDSIPI